MKAIMKVAAAVLIAALLGGLLFRWDRHGGNVAFAAVLEHIRAVQSLQFKSRTTVTPPGQKAQEVLADVIIAEPARMRQTLHAPPIDAISIWDLQAKKALTLMVNQKQATLMSLENFDDAKMPGSMNLLAELKKKDHKDFKPLGEKVINGRPTQEFSGDKDGQKMSIWVDRETQLPVQIEIIMNSPLLPSMSMLMTDFTWDVPVDESLFSLTPPAGYELVNMSMDFSPAAEKDLVNALRSMAELNGNRFTDTFDHTTLQSLILTMDKVDFKDPKSPEFKARRDSVIKAMTTVGRGYMFVGDPANGDQWHYAGKGATLGATDTPVFWYRPKNATTYRVIDAALNVRDVPEQELPKVPAVPVRAPQAGTSAATLESKPAEPPVPMEARPREQTPPTEARPPERALPPETRKAQ